MYIESVTQCYTIVKLFCKNIFCVIVAQNVFALFYRLAVRLAVILFFVGLLQMLLKMLIQIATMTQIATVFGYFLYNRLSRRESQLV